jgi:fucose 4-O-acetylase-like acetyltransferase
MVRSWESVLEVGTQENKSTLNEAVDSHARESKSAVEDNPFERLHWVDFAKSLFIFVVVLYHVDQGLRRAGIYEITPWFQLFQDFIGVYSMSGFFFIAGMFAVYSASRPLKVFLKSKAMTIVYLYFVWATIHTVIQAMAGPWTNREMLFSDIWKMIYFPPDHFWFLYTMFVCMVLFAVAIRLKINMVWFFILSLALHCTVFFPDINLGPWGVVHMVRSYLKYMALGALVGLNGKSFIWLTSQAKNSQLTGIAFMCSVFAFWCVVKDGWDSSFVTPIMSVVGCVASFCVAILLSRSGRFKFIEYIGRHSMEIYVAHVIALAGTRILLQKGLGIENVQVHFTLGLLAGFYVPIAIGYAANRLNFPYLYSLRKPKPSSKLPAEEKSVEQPGHGHAFGRGTT